MKLINGEKISQSVIAVLFLAGIFFIFLFNLKVPVTAVFSLRGGQNVEDVTAAFEENFNVAFPFKNFFVDINGAGHQVLCQREMNHVLKLDNGMTTEILPERPENEIRMNAESLAEFSKWISHDQGANFLYVQLPWKNFAYDSKLPEGIHDYSNEIADIFLNYLDEESVNYLDIRAAIQEEEVDFYSLFLKTEHHWNSYGGFYAFTKLCNYMETNFGEVIDDKVLDIAQYNQDLYKNYSLGYYGQRTGFLFSGLDDFTLIYPKFDTEQSCEIPHKEIVRNGTFYDTVFDLEKLQLPWRERGMYATYIGGDYPLVIHESRTAENEGTIMLFIDSFGTPVESFLTTAYRHVVAVDLRWVLRYGWDETSVDFIKQYKPDNVIVMLNPNQIGYAESEQFIYGLE